MNDKRLAVKHASIKQIFESMEYGGVSESTETAKAWLKASDNIYAFNGDETKPLGTPKAIHDVNTGQLLTTVHVPDDEHIGVMLESSVLHKPWFKLAALERAKLLNKLAVEIEKNAELFSQLELSVRGILPKDTKKIAVPLLIEYLQYYSSWSMKCKQKGVITAIIPDNSCLAVFGAVLGSALSSGQIVLLQTGALISVSASLIINLAKQAGFPDGAIQLIPGDVDLKNVIDGRFIFEKLYPDKYRNSIVGCTLQIVTFSNSKTPMVVFNSADLDSACDCAISAVWDYKGMLPWSTNTLLVQEDVFDEFVAKLKDKLDKIRVGSSNDKLADFSITFTDHEVSKLQKMIDDAESQGIEVYQKKQSDNFQPTLFIGARVYSNNVIIEDVNDVASATIVAFRTANEAANLANNTRQGLAASVWSENISLVNEMIKKLKVGTVWVNSHGIVKADVAYITHKRNGMGYIGGPEGIFEHLDKLPDSSFKSNQQVAENLKDIVASAKKARESWNKLSALKKIQQMMKWAQDIESNKSQIGLTDEAAEKWISSIYTSFSELSSLSSSITEGNCDLKTYREPVGLVAIVIEDTKDVKAIVGSLLLGNALVLLVDGTYFSQIGKYLPKGLFNTLSRSETNLTAVCNHKDIGIVFTSSLLKFQKCTDVKNLCQNQDDWGFVLRKTMLVKNVWSNVGSSF